MQYKAKQQAMKLNGWQNRSFLALGSSGSLVGSARCFVSRRRRCRSSSSLILGGVSTRSRRCAWGLLGLLVLLDQLLDDLFPHGSLPLVFFDDVGDSVIHVDGGVDQQPGRERVGQVAHPVGSVGVGEGHVNIEARGELLIVAHHANVLHFLDQVTPSHHHRIGGDVSKLNRHLDLVGLPCHVLLEERLVYEPIGVHAALVEDAPVLLSLHPDVHVHYRVLLALSELADQFARQHDVHFLAGEGLDHARAQALVLEFQDPVCVLPQLGVDHFLVLVHDSPVEEEAALVADGHLADVVDHGVRHKLGAELVMQGGYERWPEQAPQQARHQLYHLLYIMNIFMHARWAHQSGLASREFTLTLLVCYPVRIQFQGVSRELQDQSGFDHTFGRPSAQPP